MAMIGAAGPTVTLTASQTKTTTVLTFPTPNSPTLTVMRSVMPVTTATRMGLSTPPTIAQQSSTHFRPTPKAMGSGTTAMPAPTKPPTGTLTQTAAQTRSPG